jgi:8-oxo-dGTP diphosphatase
VLNVQNLSTPLLVVAAALIDAQGRVLMQRRPCQAVHGGLWEFPGGKIDAGESAEIALVRELREELAIAVAEHDLIPLGFASGATAARDEARALVILLYTCRTWSGEPCCLGAAEIAWYEPGSLASLAMPPLDYPLAAQLVEAISQAGR